MQILSEDVKAILFQQLKTLEDESKKTQDAELKIRLAGEIDRIANTILRTCAD